MYKFDFKLKAMLVITHDMIYELPCRSIERIFFFVPRPLRGEVRRG